MIAVQIILIAVGALLADADECSCRCNKQDVCDEQKALTTKLDNNTDEIQKWNRHYNFVRDLARSWRYQLNHVVKQQLEVGMNETLEDLKNASQKEECIQKEDLIARIQSLENSMRAIQKRADELDLTMEMISDEIRTGLHPIQPLCSPPCENGGQCVKNVCYCPPSFTGDRCQQGGPKCGVDFDSGVSNGGGNTSSVLVWPWMAAVYKNDTNGYRHTCDGSVIHRHFVLTSAGCVNGYGSDRLSVKLGLSDLKNGTHLQEYRVQSTHLHPQYKTGMYKTGIYENYGYDIALLELEEPIPFGPFVRPVCLPPREIPQGEPFYKPQSTAKAVRLREYLSSPLTASQTVFNLTILPREECRRILKELNMEKSFPSHLSFCAERSPLTFTCPYRGSPLMESRLAGGGTRTWTQVGIRSFCSEKYFFSPRLDHLRAWVDATIEASSKPTP